MHSSSVKCTASLGSNTRTTHCAYSLGANSTLYNITITIAPSLGPVLNGFCTKLVTLDPYIVDVLQYVIKNDFGGKPRSASYQTHQLENLRGTMGISDMDALRVPAPKQSVLKMLYKSLSAPVSVVEVDQKNADAMETNDTVYYVKFVKSNLQSVIDKLAG